MKTTIDLPADLVRQLKLRAVRDGRKLKDVTAEILRSGLATNRSEPLENGKTVRDKKTGLPVIQCTRPPRRQLTPDDIAEILLDQEVRWALEIPDTNVWWALMILNHQFHSVAANWFVSVGGKKSVLFCRATQQSLMRLLTVQAVMNQYSMNPYSNRAAWNITEELLKDPRVTMVPEPHGLDVHWKSYALRNTSSPKLWMDAYLAAFAVAGGYTLVTTDQAFTQFVGLKVRIIA